MKNSILKYQCILLLFLFCLKSGSTVAQQNTVLNETNNIRENILVVTDRDMYCVNEYVCFKALNNSIQALKDSYWSNVFYLELVSYDGTVVEQQKYNYGKSGAEGVLLLSEDILTGNYYLRAYTKWMRNFSHHNFFYKPITIVNPFKKNLLQNNSAGSELPILKLESNNQNSGEILIEVDKEILKNREFTEIALSMPKNIDKSRMVSVSVVKKGFSNNQIYTVEEVANSTVKKEYIPETRALSLSGKIVSERSSEPMPYHRVNLTIFKSTPEIISTVTGEDGKFYFDLSKLWGEYEIFISTGAGLKKDNPVVLIDNDFSSIKTIFPFIPFETSKDQLHKYNEICFNSQLSRLYDQEIVLSKLEEEAVGRKIFGEPDFVLKFEDYIELPTLEEYFHELIPSVSVRSVNSAKVLKIQGESAELKTSDPLVMVDMISITDIDKILKVSPQKIDRIEVTNAPYVRGSLMYGGIVSIISKGGDIAGIDLPSTGRFFEFGMFNDKELSNTIIPRGKRIPDLRNCLLWEPSVELTANSKTKLKFQTADNTGEYEIIVTTINESGTLERSVKSFVVE